MKKFLVVVDCQNDFIDGPLGSPEARAIVPNIVDKINDYQQFSKEDCLVIVTQDTHGEDYLSTQEGKNLPVEHCLKGTPGWEINKDVQAALDGLDPQYIMKSTFGSFRLAFDLLNLMEEPFGEGVEIELIGLCTDICVVTNALLLKTDYPEALISVDATCCAGVTPQTHEAALQTMSMCQVKITNWKE